MTSALELIWRIKDTDLLPLGVDQLIIQNKTEPLSPCVSAVGKQYQSWN
jgi:hypothetical protein